MEISRRGFFICAAAIFGKIRHATGKQNPTILLLNSWTSVNIGDIAHPFGFIALAKRFMPEATIVLRPSNTENGVKSLLQRVFPDLKLLTHRAAFEEAKKYCDIMINGSGADIIQRTLIEWRRETGKPFGIYGVSLNANQPHVMDRVDESLFTYFRDHVSYEMARGLGADMSKVFLGLDSTFGVPENLRDDKKAIRFLNQSGLEEGKYLCCIPRLRWSPFWLMKPDAPFDAEKNAINQKYKEQDHKNLLEATIQVVRSTDRKVLVCCEDISQIQVGKELIVDWLPPDVRPRVVWREDFWLPDEAISVFMRSAGLFGNEMHSPIMCIARGIPAIVCRFREQGPKGYMWQDIGLDEWLLDHDKPEEEERIVQTVLKMAKNPDWARDVAQRARNRVLQIEESTMKHVKEYLAPM